MIWNVAYQLEPPMFSFSALQHTLKSLTDAQTFIIAYSGGLDSHVLLHAMSALKNKNPDTHLQAVHVNHQINPNANHWALHCKKICDDLGIPIAIETVDLNLKPGDSLEENARNARYAALHKYIDKNSVLLTAHNANDQAETFLLQALRGAGPKGLSAMPAKKRLGDGFLIRPLLSFSREKLEKYALENKLNWIEDDSNVDPRFRRNFLRHAVFPVLKQYWPTVMDNFSRSSRLMAEHEKIISEIAQSDLKRVVSDNISLDIKKLLLLSDARQRLVLREWFSQNNLRMPNEKHLKHIQKDVLNVASDAHPVFVLGNVMIWRERGFLYVSQK